MKWGADDPSIVEVVEAFLARSKREVVVPLTTDGIELASFGVPIARWDGDKLVMIIGTSGEREEDKGSGSKGRKMHRKLVLALAKQSQVEIVLCEEVKSIISNG